jgi:hypothetical protein
VLNVRLPQDVGDSKNMQPSNVWERTIQWVVGRVFVVLGCIVGKTAIPDGGFANLAVWHTSQLDQITRGFR